jgi:Arc/MetJ-type ribon-helix-helix transcriptional regulator
MTIHLPTDLENSIRASVQSGRFNSLDEAMAEAARLLLREINQHLEATSDKTTDLGPDTFLGSMRDDAELMDELVAEVYRKRIEEPWRDLTVE